MITVSVELNVMHLRFNRPERKNAMTVAMYQQLIDALEQASADPQIRCVLIAGSEQCFTAGNDLNDFLNLDFDDPAVPTSRFLHTLLHFDKPIVAAVAGPAIGIGTTLLLHCDLVIAADNTQFALPFVPLGLCPEAASSLLLERYVGRRKAQELLLLGQSFTAQQALDWGLINQVVSPSDLFAASQQLLDRLTQQPSHAILASRQLLQHELLTPAAEQIDAELAQFKHCLKHPATRERLQRFFTRARQSESESGQEESEMQG